MTEPELALLQRLGITTRGAGSALDWIKAAVPALPPGLSEGIGKIAEQVSLFRSLARQQAATITENTQALIRSTAAQSAAGASSPAASIASAAARVLGGGPGLAYLAASIAGLFRGSRRDQAPAPATYKPPEAIHFEGAAPATAGMPIVPVDYGQDGLPRRVWRAAQRSAGGAEGSPAWMVPSMAPPWAGQGLLSTETGRDPAGGSARAGAPVFAPTVTVQVQAMDSRSFLDHSHEIARAVREAILNAHPLRGAISEL